MRPRRSAQSGDEHDRSLFADCLVPSGLVVGQMLMQLPETINLKICEAYMTTWNCLAVSSLVYSPSSG